MSHKNQLQFVEAVGASISSWQKNLKILEVGAHAVNGEIRNLFTSTEDYTGIDLAMGPGVSIVASGHDYGGTGSYDVAIACEVLEHNPFWLETVFNMIRVTKPGGVVVITCASTGRIEHGTTRTNPSESPGTTAVKWDYYKNISKEAFQKGVKPEAHFDDYLLSYVSTSSDLYFIGQKKRTPTKQEDSTLRGWFFENKAKIVEETIKRIEIESKWGFGTTLIYSPLRIAAKSFTDEIYQEIALPYFRLVNAILKKYKK